jgi:hypothetical protein
VPLESANYISQLNPANPNSTDTVSQADDHLRVIKQALKNTFPNLDAPVTVTPAQLNSPVPVGVILMWSGSRAAIPAGYTLCNGTTVTGTNGASITPPDLRGKFILGAGDPGLGYSEVGTTGGAATTGMAGSHTHTINATSAGAPGVTLNAVQSGTGATAVTAVSAPANHTHTANLVGDHQHTSLPPFYSVCYIMKV